MPLELGFKGRVGAEASRQRRGCEGSQAGGSCCVCTGMGGRSSKRRRGGDGEALIHSVHHSGLVGMALWEGALIREDVFLSLSQARQRTRFTRESRDSAQHGLSPVFRGRDFRPGCPLLLLFSINKGIGLLLPRLLQRAVALMGLIRDVTFRLY